MKIGSKNEAGHDEPNAVRNLFLAWDILPERRGQQVTILTAEPGEGENPHGAGAELCFDLSLGERVSTTPASSD